MNQLFIHYNLFRNIESHLTFLLTNVKDKLDNLTKNPDPCTTFGAIL